MNSRNVIFALVATLLAAGLVACAERTDPDPSQAPEAREITEPPHQVFGDHVVHYNAQLTTRVPADVARSLDIRQADNRAMLNITVMLRGDAEEREAVSAEIEVQATNLAGQLQNIPVREVRDGESIYYIGEFTVTHEEIMTFKVTVRPSGVDTAHELSFRQQFFMD